MNLIEKRKTGIIKKAHVILRFIQIITWWRLLIYHQLSQNLKIILLKKKKRNKKKKNSITYINLLYQEIKQKRIENSNRMNELKNTLNTMYGTDWQIEYKDKA